MSKKWILLLLCMAAAFTLTACGTGESGEDNGKLKVSVTFNAMKEFVEAVGQDKVEITTIIPDGTEAHDFEPKAQDLVQLSSADVFVYHGLGMESWVEEAVGAVENEGLIVVEASQGANPIESDEEEHDEESDAEESEEEHDHEGYDPHLWLGIKGAQLEVSNIKDALVEADPDNKEFYETNCAAYIEELEALYTEYSEKFQSVERNSFVTGHAAFGYLCRDFGLVQSSVRGIYSDGEPSAQQLAELVEYCREHGVTTIFAEEMASPEVSQTLANEVGAEVQTIYTMEGNEDDKTYLQRMSENLEKIYQSLL